MGPVVWEKRTGNKRYQVVINSIKCYDENKQDTEKKYTQRKAGMGTILEEGNGANHEKAKNKAYSKTAKAR